MTQNSEKFLTSMPALSADGSAVPIAWVEDLFGRLAAILGSSMSNLYANANPAVVKAEWAEALAGFSGDEVKRGIVATRTRKFAPNLPEFLHLCRPALDPEIAWIEAEQGMKAHADRRPFAWSHPAVFWACREMAFELRTSSFGQMRQRWERSLSLQFAAGKWLPIPDPQAHRIAPTSSTHEAIDPEEKARISAKLRALRQRLTGHETREQEIEARRAQAASEQMEQRL